MSVWSMDEISRPYGVVEVGDARRLGSFGASGLAGAESGGSSMDERGDGMRLDSHWHPRLDGECGFMGISWNITIYDKVYIIYIDTVCV